MLSDRGYSRMKMGQSSKILEIKPTLQSKAKASNYFLLFNPETSCLLSSIFVYL